MAAGLLDHRPNQLRYLGSQLLQLFGSQRFQIGGAVNGVQQGIVWFHSSTARRKS